MSAKEADRYAVVRQIKRLCKGVREQDTAGVISRRRGKPSNRRIAADRPESGDALSAPRPRLGVMHSLVVQDQEKRGKRLGNTGCAVGLGW